MATPESRHHEAVFARDEHRCAYMGIEGHRCAGRLTADHVIPKQTLKEAWRRAHSRLYANNVLPEHYKALRDVEVDELIADSDNGIIVCAKANMDLAAGALRPPRSALPSHVLDFAEVHGLTWYVEARYAPSQGVRAHA